MRLSLDSRLVLRSKASRTDVEPSGFAVLVDCGLMNIGEPPSVGAPLGVADVMSGHAGLFADFTLCHDDPFDCRFKN